MEFRQLSARAHSRHAYDTEKKTAELFLWHANAGSVSRWMMIDD